MPICNQDGNSRAGSNLELARLSPSITFIAGKRENMPYLEKFS